jgi:hypothetical protein
MKRPVLKASLGPALIAQYVSDRQQQITSEVISRFAIGIFDPMITRIVAELPVLELSVAVLNNFGTNLPAEKIVQRLSLLRVAEENDDRAIILD